jgi:hypothetical protein
LKRETIRRIELDAEKPEGDYESKSDLTIVFGRKESATVKRATETKIASSASHKFKPAAHEGIDHVIKILKKKVLSSNTQAPHCCDLDLLQLR